MSLNEVMPGRVLQLLNKGEIVSCGKFKDFSHKHEEKEIFSPKQVIKLLNRGEMQTVRRVFHHSSRGRKTFRHSHMLRTDSIV